MEPVRHPLVSECDTAVMSAKVDPEVDRQYSSALLLLGWWRAGLRLIKNVNSVLYVLAHQVCKDRLELILPSSTLVKNYKVHRAAGGK